MLRLSLAVVLVLLAACSKKDESPAQPAPTPEAPAKPDPAPPEPKAPEPEPLPAQADIQHGQVYWAVYLANVPTDSPLWAKANQRLEEIGFAEGDVLSKDAGCDIPIDGQDPPPKAAVGSMLLAAYYAVEADARAVAARYGGEPAPWVGQVKTMCLD